MQISDEILLLKYGNEISVIKEILLEDLDPISDRKLLEILKFAVNNPNIKGEEYVKFAKLIEVDYRLFKRIYDGFYSSSSQFNLMNFDFPSYIMEEQEPNEKEIFKSLVDILKSGGEGVEILKKFKPEHLIARSAIRELNEFLSSFLFKGDMRDTIFKLVTELKERDRYRLARVKARDTGDPLLKPLGLVGNKLKECKEYYVRVTYPFVALHDKTTLSEVVNLRMENLELEYIG